MTNKKQTLSVKCFTVVLSTLSVALIVSVCMSLVGCGDQKFGLQPQTQQFAQEVTYNREVDVLWVVDNSPSMLPRQQKLAAQVPAFLSALDATKLDYHVGVTTMNMTQSANGYNGRFITDTSAPAVVTAQTPNLLNVLTNRISIAEGPNSTTRGLDTMKAALSTHADSVNAGFLRPNALLVVIFLTDEDDTVSSSSPTIKTFLDQLKPNLPTGERSWLAHFIGVVKQNDPTCPSADWGISLPGYHYMDLVDYSGGIKDSICDADFGKSMTNVRARILEVLTEYKLSQKPRVDSIRITINGILIAQDATNGWLYYAPNTSIRFYGTAVPPQGSSIHVDYDPEGVQ